jgi:hypothetical protein
MQFIFKAVDGQGYWQIDRYADAPALDGVSVRVELGAGNSHSSADGRG